LYPSIENLITILTLIALKSFTMADKMMCDILKESQLKSLEKYQLYADNGDKFNAINYLGLMKSNAIEALVECKHDKEMMSANRKTLAYIKKLGI